MVGKVKVWGKVGGTNAFIVFPPIFLCVRGWGCFQLPNYISTQRWGCPLDAIVEAQMWRIFQGDCFSGLNSSETGLVSLLQGWENLSKVFWLANSTLVPPLTQTLVAKAWPVELSNLFCFPSSGMAFDFLCRPKRVVCHVPCVCLGMLSPEQTSAIEKAQVPTHEF